MRPLRIPAKIPNFVRRQKRNVPKSMKQPSRYRILRVEDDGLVDTRDVRDVTENRPAWEGIDPERYVFLNNRRYLGSKYRLTDFILSVVARECHDIRSVADIFAGTGVVAAAFAPHADVTVNDILYSNSICHEAWLGREPFDPRTVQALVEEYSAATPAEDNYMSENFSDTYFSRSVCRKIGFIREDIERRSRRGEINGRERSLLVASLLYAMDKIANTCGHYDAYRMNGERPESLKLLVPYVAEYEGHTNTVYNTDANLLAPALHCDLVYIDPPYNSRQYCDNYHLLENVARWEKPKVEGVARKMDRSGLKSDYCKRNAAEVFEDLVMNLDTRYILLSYNNMAQKGDGRSNARISDGEIVRILSRRGTVRAFTLDHRSFTTGLSDRNDNEERLFLCLCRE